MRSWADGGPIEMLPDTRCDDVHYWTYRDIGPSRVRRYACGTIRGHWARSFLRAAAQRDVPNTRITALLNGAAEPI